MTTTQSTAPLATEAQQNMLRNMAAKKSLPGMPVISDEEIAATLKSEVGRVKDWLWSLPWPNAAKTVAKEVVPEGVYFKDGTVYRVQTSKESGKRYAKRLSKETNKFVFASGAIFSLSIEDKMTKEDAIAYSAKISTCCVCGRTLTNKISVAEGIGPICSGRLA